METFKGSFGELQFYFKPKDEGETYLVEPYRQTRLKSFKLIKREKADINHEDKREWLIEIKDSIPVAIRDLELNFSDFIQESLATHS